MLAKPVKVPLRQAQPIQNLLIVDYRCAMYQEYAGYLLIRARKFWYPRQQMWKQGRDIRLTERDVNSLQSICYNDASLQQDAMDHFVLLVTATRHCTVSLCGNGKGYLQNLATGLPHILTHTGRSADGLGSIKWTLRFYVLLQIGQNRANSCE